MEKYNYREQVKSDILDYIAENEIKVTASNREDIAKRLNEEVRAMEVAATLSIRGRQKKILVTTWIY